MRRSIKLLAVALFLAVTAVILPAQSQPRLRLVMDQVTRPVAQVSDPSTIHTILNELLIVPMDTIPISYIEVIDITVNGFGPDDVIVTYPSEETFKIEPSLVTETVAQIMSTWRLGTEFKYDAGNAPAALFDPDVLTAPLPPTDSASGSVEDDGDLSGAAALTPGLMTEITLDDSLAAGDAFVVPSYADQKGELGIMADLLQALERNYSHNRPISLLLERNDVGFTMQMWGYQKSAMNYVPRPTIPDTTLAYDLLYVSLHDSMFVTDTTLYDVLYFYKTIEDVIYTPPPSSFSAVGSPGGDGSGSPLPPSRGFRRD